jgi:hypothetical protein
VWYEEEDVGKDILCVVVKERRNRVTKIGGGGREEMSIRRQGKVGRRRIELW